MTDGKSETNRKNSDRETETAKAEPAQEGELRFLLVGSSVYMESSENLSVSPCAHTEKTGSKLIAKGQRKGPVTQPRERTHL